MRKFVYAVAGVLALSPVIALASVSTPASAAAQHPAAADTCVDNSSFNNFFDSDTEGGWLYAAGTTSGTQVYSNNEATTHEDWCEVSGQDGYNLWRLHGTTNECLEWDSTTNIVHIEDCNSNKLAQNWFFNGEELQNEQEGNNFEFCLTSNKGSDQPVFMLLTCSDSGGQNWSQVFNS